MSGGPPPAGGEPVRFRHRADAGHRLADLVADLGLDDPCVLALPRGGVSVGAVVARRLGAPLDVLVVRKVGAPRRPELGIGAVAEDGAVVVDRDTTRALRIDEERIETLVRRTGREVTRRVALYRGDRPLAPLDGRDAVVVDDGLATGVTAAAALRAARSHRPRSLTLAVPVAAADAVTALRPECDAVVCVHEVVHLGAVGAWYDDFAQVDDAEVLELIAQIGLPHLGPAGSADPAGDPADADPADAGPADTVEPA